MALTKQKKSDIVEGVASLLGNSKLTVLASYPGTSVKAMQSLRKGASEGGTSVHVIKNRLVIKALEKDDKWKAIDTTVLKGQLLYAFNSDDEVAPAKALADFAKANPTLEFVGAISIDGQFMSSEDVKVLANLPSKDQLRGQLVGLLGAPLSAFVNVIAGNIRGVITVLNARADAIK
jgi:large subunit ribosomal protein L10